MRGRRDTGWGAAWRLALMAIMVASPLFAAADGRPAVVGSPGPGRVERVEIGLAERAPFSIFTLEHPRRVVVDFPALDRVSAPSRPAPGARLIKAVRPGARAAGRGARLVVDLLRPARVARAFTVASDDGAGDEDGADSEDGARFILTLEPTSAAAFAALAGWPEAARPVASFISPKPAAPGDLLVVVDPGHGGADPGAISRGVAEKDLVLDYARALAAAVVAHPGFDAALTRWGDEYLTLKERVTLARRAGAGVFISLHADALATGEATGASVYVLSERASDRVAAALAGAHDRMEALGGVALDEAAPDVAQVLIDFARRRTDVRSRRLAARLVAGLRDVAPVLEGRALQSAGFRVLQAPDIPSALIELGFMSSAADRARLLSPDVRDAVTAAIAAAIVDWAADERR
ncbi:N-acetylmuramoyl-L-alanine amidase [Pikeienuella sp. HZG-20]|uniref:N-acetylmuramoyl-L-alanine amidase family protein n=1 Tax=Paludibacillus litoralis TaxID=3133267 RepID=UPI0030EC5423